MSVIYPGDSPVSVPALGVDLVPGENDHGEEVNARLVELGICRTEKPKPARKHRAEEETNES